MFSNEATAFQAYRLLLYHGISPKHLAIVGQGYSRPEHVGLTAPVRIAGRKALRFAIASGAIAAMGCLSVMLLTAALDWLLVPLAALSGSVCGALVGALVGLLGEGSAVGIYRHHLQQGRYLLMMEGSETLVRWAQEVLNYYSAPSPH